MNFRNSFPLYLIYSGIDPFLEDMALESSITKALPVFTSRELATAYRDEHAKGHLIGGFETEAKLSVLLRAWSDRFLLVMFNPSRPGTYPPSVPVNVLLAQMA